MPAASTFPLHALSAHTLAALYRRGELSPLDVAHDLVAHVARCEPHLHALWAFDADAVLAAARASEARWVRGEPLSALDGVPCTIKENIATRGTPVPLGTAATELVPAAADAPPAARLREAGCVLVAKTTMPDYGMLSSGLSSFHALTRNPWHLAKNPGGSSAGAAAAAAAGYGPLHVGTDIGGSIRLPAGWCGVVGFKPSLGRVPIHPPYYGRVAGPITRRVDDAAAMMAVLARPDARDSTSLPFQALDWDAPAREPRGLRIGLWIDAGWGLPVAPEVAAVVEAAARAFERAGAFVEPLAPFATREMADGIDRFWRMRFHVEFVRLPPERRERILPFIREWVAPAAGFSAEQVFHGFSQMGALRDACVAACHPFDVVLSPVSPVASFAAEAAGPTNDPQRPFEHIAFTLPFNMGEQPAIALPAGVTPDGLPVGIQIAGRRHDDVGVLRVARLWEQLRGALPPWPTPNAW
ncbi:amidase [Calidifontimicrobium sp. SYSU G02091]|uniref:amidase n=1 Tax=Calidifontimicrobium sp. SYSU G02091 TaxID=2926421 RepID=UPI001F53D74E|nr:amidase [Calidifontimicrobium sp. SYSU G02091]